MTTTESGGDDSEGDGCCSWSVLSFCALTLGVALALALELTLTDGERETEGEGEEVSGKGLDCEGGVSASGAGFWSVASGVSASGSSSSGGVDGSEPNVGSSMIMTVGIGMGVNLRGGTAAGGRAGTAATLYRAQFAESRARGK